jgi:hypothetical protein
VVLGPAVHHNALGRGFLKRAPQHLDNRSRLDLGHQPRRHARIGRSRSWKASRISATRFGSRGKMASSEPGS